MTTTAPPMTTATSSALHSWEERTYTLTAGPCLPDTSAHRAPCTTNGGLRTVCPTARAMCTHSRGVRDPDVAGVVRCVHMYVMMSLCFVLLQDVDSDIPFT